MTQLAVTFENPAAVSNTTQMTGGAGGNLAVCSTPAPPDTIQNSSGTNCVFSQTQVMRGAYSCRLVPVSNTRVGPEWLPATLGVLPTTNYRRFYMYKTATSVAKANELLMKSWYASGATANWCFGRSAATSKLGIYDGAGTTNWSFAANALSNNTWYRVEITEFQNATTGLITVSYYLGDSTTPVETFNSGNRNIGATDDILICSDASDVTTYLDDIVVGATSPIGPSLVSVASGLGMKRPIVYS